MTKSPQFLKKGDTVQIVAPAGPLDISYINAARLRLESWGLKVIVGENATARFGVFAGTHEQRCADMQAAFDNEDVRAIFCARGGYGSIHLIPLLDFTRFLKSPKWLIGFSDITVFHARLQALNVNSIHAAMPKNFDLVNTASIESLQNMLWGNYKPIKILPSPYNIHGNMQGELVGGNLSILYSLRGLPFEYDYANKILFFEDLNEYRYHIDRILQNFKQGGVFEQIQGLLVGNMSDMKQGADPHNLLIEEIILDAVGEYSFPVCFNVPTGHEQENIALQIGGVYSCECFPENVLLDICR
jgi:muramoyltetrapeptide carboxypeptidase